MGEHFLIRLARRQVGTASAVFPRLPSRYASPTDFGGDRELELADAGKSETLRSPESTREPGKRKLAKELDGDDLPPMDGVPDRRTVPTSSGDEGPERAPDAAAIASSSPPPRGTSQRTEAGNIRRSRIEDEVQLPDAAPPSVARAGRGSEPPRQAGSMPWVTVASPRSHAAGEEMSSPLLVSRADEREPAAADAAAASQAWSSTVDRATIRDRVRGDIRRSEAAYDLETPNPLKRQLGSNALVPPSANRAPVQPRPSRTVSRPEAWEHEGPTVTVTIGRVEVRGISAPTAQPTPRRPANARGVSLEEYLEGRYGKARR